MQDEELHDEEEQAAPSGQGEVQEILSPVRQAHGTQGDPLNLGDYSGLAQSRRILAIGLTGFAGV
jgi:hypothetical protein